MTIYDRIKTYADEQGLAIYQVEQQAGIGNAVIKAWDKGNPRIDSLVKVAKVLGVTVSDLIGEEDAVPQQK